MPEQQPVQAAANAPLPFEQSGADFAPGFTQPASPPAEPGNPLPTHSTRSNAPRFERPLPPSAASRSRLSNTSPAQHADGVRARGERPSVRDELREIKAMLRTTEPVVPKPKVPIRIHRSDRAR